MDLYSLEAKNFKPRDNVIESGTQLAKEILAEIPLEGSAKVVISDKGDRFFFSVVAKSKSKLFSTESQWKKRHTSGWPRDWQITALLQILRDFARRVLVNEKPGEKNDGS